MKQRIMDTRDFQFILICAIYSLTYQVHGKIKFGSSPLFENVFLSSDFEQKNLAGLTESESLNCFPPADRHHRYEWAGGFNQKHILDELDKTNEETNDESDSESEGFDENILKKRNDKHGDLSADLFSQYPSSCACQTKVCKVVPEMCLKFGLNQVETTIIEQLLSYVCI